MRAKDPDNGRGVSSAGTVYDANLEDQSDLVRGLAYRLNATELLIGQFALLEGLPLLMESFDAPSGTITRNWASIAYACDKILSAAPASELRQEQVAVREEYLAWKSALPAKAIRANGHLQSANGELFNYEIVTVPSYRSTLRSHQPATAMGAPVDRATGEVQLEIPPNLYWGLDNAYRDMQPYAEVVAFARCFLESGDGPNQVTESE